MHTVDNSTTLHDTMQGGTSVVSHRVAKLGRQQGRVLALLAKGPATGAEITIALGLSDPRGHIAELRRKGYPIGDMWVTSPYGTHYKQYFLKKGGDNE